MYKIGYELKCDPDEGFSIASYDPTVHDAIKNCLPIKMTINEFDSTENITSFNEVVWSSIDLANLSHEFQRCFKEILDGRHEAWKLVSVGVGSEYLDFEFYSTELTDTEIIHFDITKTHLQKFSLCLEVPNADISHTSKYTLFVECCNPKNRNAPDSFTIIEAYFPHLRQRRTFMLAASNPDVLSVTDYFDL